ncbi:hypothetical protein C7974DRAFT_382297 [Boeremia exigua]|uniref:uncharacterized protein n=1 Tax=Boeremia exigua TaxID=749465 RepID=UPI001E8D1CC2|nr:uncharacterized protein C7974DRAFT_382297 [Boeremia exigua]KAH6643825.1 hypothetical protein C7974DRAFT_382297 [Boeremia exigua]
MRSTLKIDLVSHWLLLAHSSDIHPCTLTIIWITLSRKQAQDSLCVAKPRALGTPASPGSTAPPGPPSSLINSASAIGAIRLVVASHHRCWLCMQE